MEIAAIILTSISILLALYVPRFVTFVRAWILLRNVPSPPASGLLSGHAAQLSGLKRYVHQSVICWWWSSPFPHGAALIADALAGHCSFVQHFGHPTGIVWKRSMSRY